MKIAPSVLNLKEEDFNQKIDEFLSAKIKYLHLDIMDGIFVPNNTPKVELLKKVNSYPFIFDAHLMVINPKDYVDEFCEHGANIITFHIEAVDKPKELIDYIHSKNVLVGISIKPNTNPEALLPYLKDIDLVLVMSVEPGFGGQKFMDSAIGKVEFFDIYRKNNQLKYLIEVDGGINVDNSKLLKDAGCDIVVMGTYLLKNDVRNINQKVESL